ncbi:hypothetical protein MJT46_011231, partial [Ovis ammon polii x Ovis aries]
TNSVDTGETAETSESVFVIVFAYMVHKYEGCDMKLCISSGLKQDLCAQQCATGLCHVHRLLAAAVVKAGFAEALQDTNTTCP